MLQRDDAGTRLAAVAEIAERHLQRDLDRGRAAVGKEDVRQARRRDFDQAARDLFRGLMRDAGENHLIEPPGLPLDGLHDGRMIMAVGYDPPGRNAVENA